MKDTGHKTGFKTVTKETQFCFFNFQFCKVGKENYPLLLK